MSQTQEKIRRELKKTRLSKQRRLTLDQKQTALKKKICRVLKELGLSSLKSESARPEVFMAIETELFYLVVLAARIRSPFCMVMLIG